MLAYGTTTVYLQMGKSSVRVFVMPSVNLTRSDFLLKLALVGDAAVGKSALMIRYADDAVVKTYIETIGTDFVSLRVFSIPAR